MSFKEVDIKVLSENPCKLIADEWALAAAGDCNGFNMMTVSWGFMGTLWGKSCVAAFIRPQRYTLEFMNNSDYFTLSFYGNNRDIHTVCGKKSGRDIDKAAATGLTAVFDNGSVYFEEARLVLVCKKLYTSEFKKENFIDKSCLKNYDNDDFHKVFIAEIVKTLVK